MASLPQKVKLLSHAIGWGFVSADGPAASLARLIEGSLPGWSRFDSAILDDCVWIQGLRSKSADPRFTQQILECDVCVRNPRIIAAKLGSEVCATKSNDGPNPYFALNIYVYSLLDQVHISMHFTYMYMNCKVKMPIFSKKICMNSIYSILFTSACIYSTL